MWKTTFSVLLIYRAFCIVNATVEHHYEERSQRGIALLNHTFKSLYSEDYPSCLMSCTHDSRCKSFNYWWYTSLCDLNNRTKYSAEAKFLTWDFSTTYSGFTREPGIITNMPRLLFFLILKSSDLKKETKGRMSFFFHSDFYESQSASEIELNYYANN